MVDVTTLTKHYVNVRSQQLDGNSDGSERQGCCRKVFDKTEMLRGGTDGLVGQWQNDTAPCRSFCAVGEIVEEGDGIGFGPEADFAGVGMGGVIGLENVFAIENHGEVIGRKIYAQGVPLIGRDWQVGAFELRALAFDVMVNTDVVLEGICARHVIIVRVFAAPYDATRLVFFAGDGFEFHFDEAVLHTGPMD